MNCMLQQSIIMAIGQNVAEHCDTREKVIKDGKLSKARRVSSFHGDKPPNMMLFLPRFLQQTVR